MFAIKQPSKIIYGKNSSSEYNFPEKSLLITSSGAKKRNWIENLNSSSTLVFDDVEPNPSMETVTKIIKKFVKYFLKHIFKLLFIQNGKKKTP